MSLPVRSVTCSAVLWVTEETVLFGSRLLATERRRRNTRGLVQAIPAIRSRRGLRRRRPAKLHADKGYEYAHLRAWLRS